MKFVVNPSDLGTSTVRLPGDKSVSHRALMLGSIAEGSTHISGFLAGEDCLATLGAMSAMGVSIERPAATEVVVHGVGLRGLRAPAGPIDLGNSGTAMRLMAGLLAAQNFDTTLTGDASLTGRPMQRVITPLAQMGAKIRSDDGRPPLHLTGNPSLRAIHYELPVASAQVKSAVLLAGLYAKGKTSVVEPAVTRDHTERMLASMGIEVEKAGARISMSGSQRLRGTGIRVPADLSSAAFIILAAIIARDADILIHDVGVNPTRTGVIDVLRGMGADISLENPRSFGSEPVADIRARSSDLKGGEVDPALVSLAIDEFPVLFIASALASGKSRFTGIGELRLKESDRIATMVEGLRELGVEVEEFTDGAVVYGGEIAGGVVTSHGDHRVAMSFAVAGTAASDTVVVDDVAAVDTSFPGFVDCLGSLGVDISAEEKQ